MDKIFLNTVENIRDLGGTETASGRRIKPGLLIRSAALDRLSGEEAALLRDRHNLRLIIDLRTHTEVAEKPDRLAEGLELVHIPVFGEETIGISREKKTEKSLLENELPDMAGIYRQMISDAAARAQLSKVLRLIMEPREGAVLWHCTAGKDRCGMTAALVETMLGLEREAVLADYMLTNEVAEPFAKRFYDIVMSKTGNERRARGVYRAFVADRDYMEAAFDEMDKLYGGIGGYIEKGLGIDKESIADFRGRTLE